MQVDWIQKWLSFHQKGTVVTLQGLLPIEFVVTMVFVSTVICPGEGDVAPDMQVILDEFASRI